MSKDRIDVKSPFQRHALMIDYNGKLAFTWGWEVSKKKPEENRQLKVSKFSSTEWYDLIGQYIEDWQENTGRIYRAHNFESRPVYIHAEDFSETVTETRPVPRPRKGKDRWGKYDWKYVGDGFIGPYWEKVYLPGEE